MTKVILDTNFLIYCTKQKIDYVSRISSIVSENYELAVVKPTIVELHNLAEKAKKLADKNAAKLALKLLDFNKVQIINAPGKKADSILKALGKKGNIIATLDKKLKYNLSRIIVIVGKKKLVLT